MNPSRIKNIDFGKNQITDKIRVSTAAIYREDGSLGLPYWLVETWIFSDDPRQESHQIIHGTPTVFDRLPPVEIAERAVIIHMQITDNLRKRHGGWRAVFYRHMWT